MKNITIGVLALQGNYKNHRPHIEKMGARYLEVKNIDQFDLIDGLIVSGGESSVMIKLITHLNLKQALNNYLSSKPCWGICAGSILMSQGDSYFNTIDIQIKRNAYGAQINSFETKINDVLVSFIRAPKIINYGTNVKVLESLNDFPVWLEQDQKMVTTFHPELSLKFPSIFHQYFYDKILAARSSK